MSDKDIYMILRTLHSVHDDIFAIDITRKVWRPGLHHADRAAEFYNRETARNMAERIATRSAILLKCDLRAVSGKATIDDARKEKEIAQAICDAGTEKQLNAALEDMRSFFLELRSR